MLVDIHTHILPGIDDGARNPEMAEQMLKQLQADGVTNVVLTPHFYFQDQSIDRFLEKRSGAWELLRTRLPENVKLHLGAEVAFSGLSIDYRQFRRLGIDDGRYILLELPYQGELDKQILPKLEQLCYQTGMQPIIAHVERYQGIHGKPWLAAELINMGCLLQVNAEAVLESRRGSLLDALFSHGQAHLLGSDCHNITNRRPAFGLALDRIEQQYGSECKDYLMGIAKDVLEGARVQVSADSRIRRILGKYR